MENILFQQHLSEGAYLNLTEMKGLLVIQMGPIYLSLKILQKLSEGHTKFPNIFQKFLEISEDNRRLLKTFKEDPKMFRSYTGQQI